MLLKKKLQQRQQTCCPFEPILTHTATVNSVYRAWDGWAICPIRKKNWRRKKKLLLLFLHIYEEFQEKNLNLISYMLQLRAGSDFLKQSELTSLHPPKFANPLCEEILTDAVIS